MLGQILLRFLIGGAVVSAFAAIGEVFSPKSFSGLFGAAPSVALASLGIAFVSQGAPSVAVAARWMLVATAAMFAYASCCIALGRRHGLPMWISAAGSWVVWFAVAGASLWWLSEAVGT
ncbi:MAG TPA: hypothetical protein VGF94_30520 [Kofleriaceae bacterium]